MVGLVDGMAPQTVTSHPFLPDNARRALGIRDNHYRFGRDAYLLRTMIACRPAGCVHLFFSRANLDGDPLQPSRLLFLCADQNLPRRVEHCFREQHEPTVKTVPRGVAWKVRIPPPRDNQFQSLSVTAFRNYLFCPFRFYLDRGLNMAEADDRKTEMNAFDFGNLCHQVWHAFFESEARNLTDEARICSFLWSRADALIHEQFGPVLSLPLMFQRESLHQRLGAAARVQAQAFQQGWRIDKSEHPCAVEIDGVTVHGKLDRIDRNIHTGAVRILDYKTSDKRRTPEAEHLAWLRPDTPEYARADALKKRWTNLQIPLYVSMLKAQDGMEAGQAGYFVLPKAMANTGILIWNNLDATLIACAEQCARNIIGRIREHRFWPPASVRDDNYATLFFNRPEDHIEEDWIEKDG